ncbi:MAG: right-handed parallel beta-helix repeat-containing protein [Candidatus Saccharibacteria bacterium]
MAAQLTAISQTAYTLITTQPMGPNVDCSAVGNILRNTGDDGIAVVSLVASGTSSSRIVIANNTVYNSAARGISVVGGDSITINSNTISLTDSAGIYVSQESSFLTSGSSNIHVSGNTVVGACTRGGSSTSHYGIQLNVDNTTKLLTGIRISGNLVIKPRLGFISALASGTSMTDLTIVDNHLVGPPITTSGTFGILIGGGVAGCTCSGNRITYAGTTGIMSYGVDVICEDNTIYKPGQSGALYSWGIENYGGTMRTRNNIVTPDAGKTALNGSVYNGPTSVAAGANAGTSPPAPVFVANMSSTDDSGQINFGSGSSPAIGAQVVVVFQTPYGVTPKVLMSPLNSVTAALQCYISSVSTTGFTVSTLVAPAASQSVTKYLLDYAVQLV